MNERYVIIHGGLGGVCYGPFFSLHMAQEFAAQKLSGDVVIQPMRDETRMHDAEDLTRELAAVRRHANALGLDFGRLERESYQLY